MGVLSRLARCWCLPLLVAVPRGHSAADGDCGEGLRLEELISEYEDSARHEAPRATPDAGARPRFLSAKAGNPILVEVYFLATCSHCYRLIHNALIPLLEAQLPGDEVTVTFLPVLKGMSSSYSCKITDACLLALAPLCALQDTLPMPAPADSEILLQGARFVDCNIAVTTMGFGNDKDATRSCAEEAGISGFDKMQTCFDGQEAFDIMYSTDYADNVVKAMHRLRMQNFTQPPSMPWVFLDGDLLACEDTGECVGVSAPEGGTRFKNPGSLLDLVCDRLGDGPGKEQCDKARSERPEVHKSSQPAEAEVTHCDKCFEVGSFQWRSHREAGWRSVKELGVVCAMMSAMAASVAVCLGVRALFVSRRRTACDRPDPTSLKPAGVSPSSPLRGVAAEDEGDAFLNYL